MEILERYNKFYVNDMRGNQVAEIVFIPTGDHLSIIKYVDADLSLKGQSVGERLVAKVVEKMRQEQRKVIPSYLFAKHEFDNTREYDDIRAWYTGTGANRCIFLALSAICWITLMGEAVDQVREMLVPYRR